MYPQRLNPVPTGIEVWLLEFDFSAGQHAMDWPLLSQEEKDRAQRFFQLRDRLRFVSTRAALRRLLSARVTESPDKLQIATNAYGKPYLQKHSELAFNVSHAGHFALIALSIDGEIGVDIEQCRCDVSDLTHYMLSPLEQMLQLWPKEDLIQLWVAKEAVLKALGYGIADYLQMITVWPQKLGKYIITHEQAGWPDIAAWPLSVPGHYQAALALIDPAGAKTRLQIRQPPGSVVDLQLA